MHPNTICSHSSLQVNEPLPGTAPHSVVWMLLEYDGIWGEKAFQDSNLPATVKAHLRDLLDQIPLSRLLMIRQHIARRVARQSGRLTIDHTRKGIRFYLALATEQQPLLYDFSLDSYEDLLEINIPAAVASAEVYRSNISRQVLALICTNGRRDWCCARYGAGLYQEFVQVVEATGNQTVIWQSSHLGGHRFAPNIACFPHGLFYGRIGVGELRSFLNEISHGRMYVAKSRGRACYPPHVQAAEIYLRQSLSSNEPDEYQLLEVVERQSNRWMVRFQSEHDGLIHLLEIVKETGPEHVFKSCNDPVPSPLVTYRLAEGREMEG